MSNTCAFCSKPGIDAMHLSFGNWLYHCNSHAESAESLVEALNDFAVKMRNKLRKPDTRLGRRALNEAVINDLWDLNEGTPE